MLTGTFYDQLASGMSLYLGLGLLAGGWILRRVRGPSRWLQAIELLLVVVGASGVILSSVPVPRWLLVVWGLSCLVWCGYRSSDGNLMRVITAVVFAGASLAIVLLDLPYQRMPASLKQPPAHVTIIGDSLSTGIHRLPEEQLWPNRLQRKYRVRVTNISRGGARLDDAVRWLRRHGRDLPGDVIVLEIGGNDILEETPPGRFREALNELLERTDGSRPVYMFELPLPPLGFAYGRIQRRLADRHEVRLIPKRFLSELIFTRSTTLDGLHFSEEGHRRMTRLVAGLLGLAPRPVNERRSGSDVANAIPAVARPYGRPAAVANVVRTIFGMTADHM